MLWPDQPELGCVACRRATLLASSTDFDLRRQIAELEMVVSSPSASKLLADNYVGMPLS